MTKDRIRRILVVDGEILIAMEAAQILEETIACEAMAANWRSLASKCVGVLFDLVIADCDVEDSMVGEAFEHEATRSAYRIYLTTDDRRIGLGQATHVLKPFTPDDLISAVAIVLK